MRADYIIFLLWLCLFSLHSAHTQPYARPQLSVRSKCPFIHVRLVWTAYGLCVALVVLCCVCKTTLMWSHYSWQESIYIWPLSSPLSVKSVTNFGLFFAHSRTHFSKCGQCFNVATQWTWLRGIELLQYSSLAHSVCLQQLYASRIAVNMIHTHTYKI